MYFKLHCITLTDSFKMTYINVCECEHLYGRIHINDKLISYIMEIYPSGLPYFWEEFLWALAGNLVEIRMNHIEGSWQRHVQHWTWILGLLWELLVHQLKTTVHSQMEVPIRIYTLSKYTTNVTTYKIYKPLISMIYFFLFILYT